MKNSKPSTSVPAQPEGETPKFVCSACNRSVNFLGDFPLWRHEDGSIMCEDAIPMAEPTATVDAGEGVADKVFSKVSRDLQGLMCAYPDQFKEFAAAIIREQNVSRPLQGWVSVAERLPELEKWVVVYLPAYKATWVWRREETVSVLGWRWDDGDFWRCPTEAVTHWQPLPPAPPATSREEE